MLRNEVKRLNVILNSHKSCPISLDEFRDEIKEDSRISLNVESSSDLNSFSNHPMASFAIPSSPQLSDTSNKIYKILSIDPLEINKSLHSVSKPAYERSRKNNFAHLKNVTGQENLTKVYTTHTNLDADNSQVIDLSFSDNEGVTKEHSNTCLLYTSPSPRDS